MLRKSVARGLVLVLNLVVACCTLTLSADASAQTVPVLYVDLFDGSATPPNFPPGEGDWSNAFKFLQDALVRARVLAAQPQVNRVEIWVRGATGDGIKYRPDQSAANPSGTNDPSDTFALSAKVHLFGGFHTTMTDLSQRQPALYRTILTGEIGASWVYDNSHTVVTASPGFGGAITFANCTLDGFEITGAYQPTCWGARALSVRRFNHQCA